MTVGLKWRPRYFDIGVNFSDQMFAGVYHGSRKHAPDLHSVIARAHTFGVDKMLITASTIDESALHLDLVAAHSGMGSTVGVHPCAVAAEFYGADGLLPNWSDKLQQLRDIATRDGVRAFGEIGLDYDRLHYSSKEQQKTMFARQLEVAASLEKKLPLFLHMRAACDDFVAIIEPFFASGRLPRHGVVHSFTGSSSELQSILALGLDVGINGCSLKTEENLEVARMVPLEKLHIETDAPWCEMRKSHASYGLLTPYPNLYYPELESVAPAKVQLHPLLPFPLIKKENWEKHQRAVEHLETAAIGPLAPPLVKSRNEPVFVGHVAEVLAKLHGVPDTEVPRLVDTLYGNSCRMFGM